MKNLNERRAERFAELWGDGCFQSTLSPCDVVIMDVGRLAFRDGSFELEKSIHVAISGQLLRRLVSLSDQVCAEVTE